MHQETYEKLLSNCFTDFKQLEEKFSKFYKIILNNAFVLETNPDCKDVVCETDITEDCPYASSRYYHYMERGACCPRSSRCVCDEVCPKNIECPENLRPFLIKKGTGRLESCCDQYECKNKGQDYVLSFYSNFIAI